MTFADLFWPGNATITTRPFEQHHDSFSFLFIKGFCPHGCREKLRAFGGHLQAAQRADCGNATFSISHHKLWIDTSYLQQITYAANPERLALANRAAVCNPDPRSKHPEVNTWEKAQDGYRPFAQAQPLMLIWLTLQELTIKCKVMFSRFLEWHITSIWSTTTTEEHLSLPSFTCCLF